MLSGGRAEDVSISFHIVVFVGKLSIFTIVILPRSSNLRHTLGVETQSSDAFQECCSEEGGTCKRRKHVGSLTHLIHKILSFSVS